MLCYPGREIGEWESGFECLSERKKEPGKRKRRVGEKGQALLEGKMMVEVSGGQGGGTRRAVYG